MNRNRVHNTGQQRGLCVRGCHFSWNWKTDNVRQHWNTEVLSSSSRYCRAVQHNGKPRRRGILIWPCIRCVWKVSLWGRTRQIKDIVLHAITFLCSPFGMNNKGYSPCLSFNSIFTPCQMHLGAFHHRCSPSATFSSVAFVLTVNVWWTPQ